MIDSKVSEKINLLFIENLWNANNHYNLDSEKFMINVAAEMYRYYVLNVDFDYTYKYNIINTLNSLYISIKELERKASLTLFNKHFSYNNYISYEEILQKIAIINFVTKDHEKEVDEIKEPIGPIFTYLMKDGNGYTKIGRSSNPKIRETTLQSENPTIEMIAICENNVEKNLHDEYKEFRGRGEWFKLNNKQLDNIIRKYKFTFSLL